MFAARALSYLVVGATPLEAMANALISPNRPGGLAYARGKLSLGPGMGIGGAEGNRTPDLCSAIAALSHLSYGPTGAGIYVGGRCVVKEPLRRRFQGSWLWGGAARYGGISLARPQALRQTRSVSNRDHSLSPGAVL